MACLCFLQFHPVNQASHKWVLVGRHKSVLPPPSQPCHPSWWERWSSWGSLGFKYIHFSALWLCNVSQLLYSRLTTDTDTCLKGNGEKLICTLWSPEKLTVEFKDFFFPFENGLSWQAPNHWAYPQITYLVPWLHPCKHFLSPSVAWSWVWVWTVGFIPTPRTGRAGEGWGFTWRWVSTQTGPTNLVEGSHTGSWRTKSG